MSEKDIIRAEITQLEKIINMTSESIDTPIPLEKPSNIRFTNFGDIIEECNIQASKIVNNTALFFINQEDIDNNLHISDKIEMDKMELSNLLFQSRAAQSSYVKLLEEIDAGNVHPRIFEVQAGLQKSMMEITKSKTTYIQIMEASWRDVKNELEISGKSAISAETQEVSENGTRVRGTKDFLRDIQNRIKDENPDKTF